VVKLPTEGGQNNQIMEII